MMVGWFFGPLFCCSPERPSPLSSGVGPPDVWPAGPPEGPRSAGTTEVWPACAGSAFLEILPLWSRVGLAPPFPVLSEAGFLPGLTLASCAAAGGDVFSLLMGLAMSLVISLFIRPLQSAPKGPRMVGRADSCVPRTPLERSVALGCLVDSAALPTVGERAAPAEPPMPLVVRLGGLACRVSGKLAVGVFCVFSGAGVFLLKKLLSGEVLPVLICPLEATVGDAAPTTEPVLF